MDRAARPVGGEGPGTVRGLSEPARRCAAAALLVAAAFAACASPGAPPGGPPDRRAPELVSITPDSAAVNARPDRVVFEFDEVVAERPTGAGAAATLDGAFLVSPRDGEPRVQWKRDRLTVRPRRRWRPNTVYVVTLLPGLADLRGNVRTEGAEVVFSTGPTIPQSRLTGVAFDWPAGRPLLRPFVQAISRPDSTVYVTIGDSTGRFAFTHLPPGRFTVRAFGDQNLNRDLDPRELWDSATVTLADTAIADLYAFVHDTLGPRIGEVTVADSVTVRVRFDKPLDPSQELSAALFTLRAADSSIVPIAAALTPRAFEDAQAAAQRARADSAARADSIRADSARAAGDTTPRGPRIPRPAPAQPAPDTAAADTMPEGPRMARPVPIAEAVLQLGARLTPATAYRLRASGVRNLLGIAGASERAFTTARPRATTDSTRADSAQPRARPDSTRRDSARADTARAAGEPAPRRRLPWLLRTVGVLGALLLAAIVLRNR